MQVPLTKTQVLWSLAMPWVTPDLYVAKSQVSSRPNSQRHHFENKVWSPKLSIGHQNQLHSARAGSLPNDLNSYVALPCNSFQSLVLLHHWQVFSLGETDIISLTRMPQCNGSQPSPCIRAPCQSCCKPHNAVKIPIIYILLEMYQGLWLSNSGEKAKKPNDE